MGWPLFEPEHKEIIKYYKHRFNVFVARPLVDFVEGTGLDWHAIAPSPTFNYAVVHLWSTGARMPNRKHIAEIKRLNGLSDADVPIPDDSAVEFRAIADTMTWIRGRWFAAPGEPHKVITAHQVRAYEIAVNLRDAQIQREGVVDWVAILEAIRSSVPQAEIWTLTDLTRLKKDWERAHCGFKDADIEAKVFNDH